MILFVYLIVVSAGRWEDVELSPTAPNISASLYPGILQLPFLLSSRDWRSSISDSGIFGLRKWSRSKEVRLDQNAICMACSRPSFALWPFRCCWSSSFAEDTTAWLCWDVSFRGEILSLQVREGEDMIFSCSALPPPVCPLSHYFFPPLRSCTVLSVLNVLSPQGCLHRHRRAFLSL